MKSLAWLMLVANVLAGTPVLACKRPYSDAELIRAVVAQEFDAVVVVEVVEVADEQGQWRAVGRRTQIVEGKLQQASFAFGVGDVVISSCGPRIPQPARGQSWVLYLRRSGDEWRSEARYPWDLVSEHDVRLWRVPGPRRNLTVDDLTPTAK